MTLRGFLSRAASVAALNMLSQVAGVLLGVVLARWLGPADYGVYSLVMAGTVVALVVVCFGLPTWLMREIAAGRADPQRQFGHLYSRRAFAIVAGSGGLVMALLAGLFWAGVADPELRAALWTGLLLLPLLAVRRVLSSSFLGWGQPGKAQLIEGLLPSLLILVLLALCIWGLSLSPSPLIAIWARIGSVVGAIGIGLLWLRGIALPAARRPAAEALSVTQIIRAAWPFALIAGAAILLAKTDILMLGMLSTTTQAGIYNIALQGGLLVQLALNVSNAISAPEFSRLYAAKDIAQLERTAIMTSRSLTLAGWGIAVVLALGATPLITTVFGADYAEAAPVLRVLAIGFAASFVFGDPGFMLNMTGHERVSLRIYGILVVTNIALNSALIPLWGGMGAASATVLSLLLNRALGWRAVRYHVGISCGAFRLAR